MTGPDRRARDTTKMSDEDDVAVVTEVMGGVTFMTWRAGHTDDLVFI